MTNKELTVEEYEQICQTSRAHGRLLFTDLYVAETVLPEVYTPAPKFYPPGVKRDRRMKLHFLNDPRRERIDGVEAVDHGVPVFYQKTWEKVGDEERLVSVMRHTEKRYAVPLTEIGSHYHVSSASMNHTTIDEGLGRPVIGLGGNIAGFEGACEVFGREVLIYLGEIEPPKPTSLMVGPYPAPELGAATFREYLMGFRQGAIDLKRDDIVGRVETLLDRLP